MRQEGLLGALGERRGSKIEFRPDSIPWESESERERESTRDQVMKVSDLQTSVTILTSTRLQINTIEATGGATLAPTASFPMLLSPPKHDTRRWDNVDEDEAEEEEGLSGHDDEGTDDKLSQREGSVRPRDTPRWR